MSNTSSSNRGALVTGAILIVIGLVFLTGQFLQVNLWRLGWPFFIIVPGMMFFAGAVLGGKGASGLVVPGSIVTTVGLILLFQSITNYWLSWAYAWTLIFPASVGLGVLLLGSLNGNAETRRAGTRMAVTGLALFVLLGALYELNLWHLAWPLMIIALGVYLLVGRRPAAPQPPPLPPAELR